MVALDVLATAVFMVIVVGPVVGVTWHSIRSDHHSPPLFQEVERELEDEL